MSSKHVLGGRGKSLRKFMLSMAICMGFTPLLHADDFLDLWTFSRDQPDLPALREMIKTKKDVVDALNPLFLFVEIFEKLKPEERTEDLCRDRVIDALLDETALQKRVWSIMDTQHKIKSVIHDVASGRGASAMKNFNIDRYVQDTDPEVVDKIVRNHQEILLSYLEARQAYSKMGHLDREKVLAVKAKLTGAILLPFPSSTCRNVPKSLGGTQ
ncbi:MAG: hypothetical protein J0L93_01170 [Deltaproteobacteria bacterium]|nr:hypothetical protein [Deltaproteobacteria bacterium]